jgi:hypothetical protein
MTTSNKFLAAFLSFALVIVGALVTIPSGALDWKAAIQLGIIGLTAAVTLLLPLVPSAKWQGVLKTGIPVLLAILNGLTPLILTGRYDHATIGLIVLNGLQVLASEIGVQARIAAAPTAPAVPAV